MFKTVLFPLDRSREAREAVDVVINIVETYSSQLILLSVVQTDSSDVEEDMSSAEAVAELLANAQNLFSDKGIQTEIVEREGKPAFTICDVADELDVDLIVMGCRGLGLTEEGASESVTNRVINLSPCPVLIVP
jgi:nucleotide-binding universal stress UspA family protein